MRKFNVLAIACLSLLLALTSGCEKPGDLGKDIVENPDDQLNMVFTDTVSITAYSEIIDSISGSSLNYNLLGSYYDDVFGTTTASIYTQLRLSQTNVDFGSNAVCDSVILTLDYVGDYGDSTAIHNLKVYEVLEDLYPDSTYYSNYKASISTNDIGSQAVVFNTSDSILYGSTMVEPHLIFHLNNSFGEKIMAKSGQSELADNASFQSFMKGIYITEEKTTSKGGFAYVDLMSALSIVSIHYHNDTDTLVYKFAINEFCSYFSNFEHYNYADAAPEVIAQIVNKDTSLGNQNLYTQSLGGVRTHFNFPYLDELTKDGPIAIQNAELILPVKSGTVDDMNPAVFSLAVVKIDSLGKPQFVDDYFEGDTYFGGNYDSDKNIYKFNLNRHMHAIINGSEKNYGMQIIAKGASIYGNRVVLGGTSDAQGRMRLRLTYTKVTN